MKCISGTNPYRNLYETPVPSYGTAGRYERSNTVSEAGAFGGRDVVEVSADWAKETRDFLEQMKQEYRGIHIAVRESADMGSVPELAAGLGKGTHLIINRDFLDRMGSSREDYLACRTVMEDILRQLLAGGKNSVGNGAVLDESSAAFWSVPAPAAQNAAFPAQSTQSAADYGIPDTRESPVRVSAGSTAYSPALSYARLAGASTKGQVRTVMGEAHRSIASLRLVIALGDDKEKAKARAAVGSLQKLLVRGSRKIRKLDEETLLKIRRNRAEKKRQLKKARILKQELEKKRSVRRTFDGVLRTEGLLDEANRKLRFHDEKDQETVSCGAVGMDMSFGGGAAAGLAGGGFTAADVVVSEAVSF